MSRICLLTPGHLSTNPRLVKEADALAEAGHDVTVIAASYSPWATEADRVFADRQWRRGRTVHFGPYAPLRTRWVQLLRHYTARLVSPSHTLNSTLARAAFHPVASELVAAAREVKADLYIAHYIAALPAAALAARHHQVRYAFDAEDFHPCDAPDTPEHESQRKLVRALEERYLRGCAYITAASSGIADAYAQTYGIPRPAVVLNVFPRGNGPPSATARGSAEPAPSIYWFSQTIGAGRGLDCAVSAIGYSRSRPHLFLRGTPAAGIVDSLYRLARQANVADHVHVLPPALPTDMERLAAAYDVGFSGEPGFCRNNELALGNKVFSYLLAGLPVIASAIPAHVDIARELKSAMRLYAIQNAHALAEAYDELLLDPDKLASARSAAYAAAARRFNWDVEKAVLCEQVARALRSEVAPAIAMATS
jgi:glycosyltransferase involved in cell wall biosynthesis